MNKRGQLFLIAALVIISVLAGLTKVTNAAMTPGTSQTRFYHLTSEVEDETKQILDYGVANEEDIDTLAKEFLAKYATYIGQDEVIFIYGNKEGVLQALVFQEEDVGSIALQTGGIKEVQIDRITEKIALVEVLNDRVSVKIDNIVVPFELKEGENFFFIIRQNSGEERYAASG